MCGIAGFATKNSTINKNSIIKQMTDTKGKYILKDTFKDLLPESIMSKPKSGFRVTINGGKSHG